MSLKKIGRLKPAEYSYNNPSSGETERLSMGVMAQDIDKIWPYEKYSILIKDMQGNFAVDYSQLIAPMIKSIQELSAKVDELQKQLDK
tara:strand:+ start:120 stop:383 length:264 start_codon:yes stop_codon:yes gene_type:complete